MAKDQGSICNIQVRGICKIQYAIDNRREIPNSKSQIPNKSQRINIHVSYPPPCGYLIRYCIQLSQEIKARLLIFVSNCRINKQIMRSPHGGGEDTNEWANMEMMTYLLDTKVINKLKKDDTLVLFKNILKERKFTNVST
jgi:hypothetical protein